MIYSFKSFKFNKEEILRLIDEKNYQVEYKLNNNNTELIFMHKYSLLNKAIIDSIFENETKSIKIKPSQIINNKKIIIKYEEKKAILIGTINEDDISNIFIPEIILVYDDIKQLENQFNFFENNDYDKFKEAFDLKEKITDLKEDDKIIGKAYLIDKNKYNNLINYNENILSNLYNNYESINNKIKQPYEKELKMDKYFIINSNYIKKLKELFKFNDLLKLDNKNSSINEIIEKEKLNLDINLIKDELSKEEFSKIDKKELIIDENNKIQYYQEFDIISKELNDYLEEYNLIQPNQEILEIECLFGENKIIMTSLNDNKKISIVISKNEKDKII